MVYLFRSRAALGLLVAFFGLCAGHVAAQAPAWAQAEILPGFASDVVFDPSGNMYVTGIFNDTISFGSHQLINTDTLDQPSPGNIYVAKRTAAGVWEWAIALASKKYLTTPGALDEAGKLSVGPTGDVFVAGAYGGQKMGFGTDTLRNSSWPTLRDVYVAKLSPAGVWQWAARVVGGDNESVADLRTDARGNVYLLGSSQSPYVRFGTTQLTNSVGVGSDPCDLFVAKLSPNGIWQWAQRAGEPEDEQPGTLVVDAAGNTYLSGRFSTVSLHLGTLTLQGAPLASGNASAFVAKLDTAGVWQWGLARQIPLYAMAYSLSIDDSSHVYVAGNFRGATTQFGATTLYNQDPSGQTSDVFVARLTPGGTWQWATRAGGPSVDYANGLAFAGAGQLYVAGSFRNTPADFGGVPLTSQGDDDAFVARLTTQGHFEWGMAAGGSTQDWSMRPLPQPDGSVSLLGGTRSPLLHVGAAITLVPRLPYYSSFLARLTMVTGLQSFESDADSFTLYPNPAHHTVRLTGTSAATADIVDALGRTVRTLSTSNLEPTTVNLLGLPAGLYVVRCGGATRRLVVE